MSGELYILCRQLDSCLLLPVNSANSPSILKCPRLEAKQKGVRQEKRQVPKAARPRQMKTVRMVRKLHPPRTRNQDSKLLNPRASSQPDRNHGHRQQTCRLRP
jgi:hypothetical protein